MTTMFKKKNDSKNQTKQYLLATTTTLDNEISKLIDFFLHQYITDLENYLTIFLIDFLA